MFDRCPLASVWLILTAAFPALLSTGRMNSLRSLPFHLIIVHLGRLLMRFACVGFCPPAFVRLRSNIGCVLTV